MEQTSSSSCPPSYMQKRKHACFRWVVHASRCHDANCNAFYCGEMKTMLHHTQHCQLKDAVCKCYICDRMMNLCCFHARHCRAQNCDISICAKIKMKLSNMDFVQSKITALVHATACHNDGCTFSDCKAMKVILTHLYECKIMDEECYTCENILDICYAHACSCKTLDCDVPSCSSLKAEFEKNAGDAQTKAANIS